MTFIGEQWGPEWKAWAESYPPKIAQKKPEAPWHSGSDYIEAVKACDYLEMENDLACEVLLFEDVFYVVPKGCMS